MPTISELYGNPLTDVTLGGRIAARTRTKMPKPVQPEEEEQQQAPPMPRPMPQMNKGILAKTGDAALSGLAAVGNVLDLPGSSVRDVLTGNNPFDQWLSPTSDRNRVTGRDMLRQYGLVGKENDWSNFGTGLAAEMLTDPLTYTGIGVVTRGAGLASRKAGLLKNVKPKINSQLAKAAEKTGKQAEKAGWMQSRMMATPGALINEADDPASALADFMKAGGTEDMLDQPIYTLAQFNIPWAKWIPGLKKTKLATGTLDITGKKLVKNSDNLRTKPKGDGGSPGSGPDIPDVPDGPIDPQNPPGLAAPISEAAQQAPTQVADEVAQTAESVAPSTIPPQARSFTPKQLLKATKITKDDPLYEHVLGAIDHAAEIHGKKLTVKQVIDTLDEAKDVGFTPDDIAAIGQHILRANEFVPTKKNLKNAAKVVAQASDATPEIDNLSKGPTVPNGQGVPQPAIPLPEGIKPETLEQLKSQESWLSPSQLLRRNAALSKQPLSPLPQRLQAPGEAINALEPFRAGVDLDGVKAKAVPYSGKKDANPNGSLIGDGGGRPMVVMDVDGVRVPFYQSTGGGGKTLQAGAWYPFFGINPEDNWINKIGAEAMSQYYGSPKLAKVAQALDDATGNLTHMLDTGRRSEFQKATMNPGGFFTSQDFLDWINKGHNPVGDSDTAKNYENIARVMSQLEGPSWGKGKTNPAANIANQATPQLPSNTWNQVSDTSHSFNLDTPTAKGKVTLDTTLGNAHIEGFGKTADAPKGAGKAAVRSLVDSAAEQGAKTVSGIFDTHAALGAFAHELGKDNVRFFDKATGEALDIGFDEAMKEPGKYVAQAEIKSKTGELTAQPTKPGPESMTLQQFMEAVGKGKIGPAEQPGFTRLDRPQVDVRHAPSSADEIATQQSRIKSATSAIENLTKGMSPAEKQDWIAKNANLPEVQSLLRLGDEIASGGASLSQIDTGINLGYSDDDIASYIVHSYLIANNKEYRKLADSGAAQEALSKYWKPDVISDAYHDMQRRSRDFDRQATGQSDINASTSPGAAPTLEQPTIGGQPPQPPEPPTALGNTPEPPEPPRFNLKDRMAQGTEAAQSLASTVGNWIKQLPEGIADPVAKAIDSGSNTVLAIPGVKDVVALLDRRVMGARTLKGQEISRVSMEAIDNALHRTRETIAPLVRAVEGTQHFDLEHISKELNIPAEEAIKVSNERAMAFRAFTEGVDSAFYNTQHMPQELHDIGTAIRQMFDDSLEFEAKQAGLDVGKLKDEYALYVARQARKPGKAYSRNPFSGPLFEVEHYGMKGREEFLKNLPAGTSVIDEMSVDPKISGIINSAPTIAQTLKKSLKFPENKGIPNLVQQRQYVHQTYGPKLNGQAYEQMRELLPDDGSKTWQQAWQEAQQKSLDDAAAIKAADPEAPLDIFDPKSDDRYDRIISFINSLDPSYVKENAPLFGRNLLHDTMQRVQNGLSAGYAAMAAQRLIGETLQLGKTTTEAQGEAFEKLLTEMRLNTPKSLENIIGNMSDKSREMHANLLDQTSDQVLDKINKTLGTPPPEEGAYQFITSIKRDGQAYQLARNSDGNLGLLKKGNGEDVPDYFEPLPAQAIEKEDISGLLTEKINREFLAKHNMPVETAQEMTRWMKPFSAPEEIGAVRQVLERFSNMFRANVTAPFPGFHVRNGVSAVAQNILYKTGDPDEWGPMRYAKPMQQAYALRSGQIIDGMGATMQKLKLLDDDYVKQWAGSEVKKLKKQLVSEVVKSSDPTVIDAIQNRIRALESTTLANADVATLDAIGTKKLADLVFENAVTGSKQGQAAEVIGDQTDILRSQMPGLDTSNPLKGQIPAAPPDATVWDQMSPNMVQGGMTFTGKPVDADYFLPTRAGRAVGELTEDVVRIAPFIGLLKQGYSPAEAAKMVGKIQVDYSKLSQWERKYARTAIPFWTFSKNLLATTAQDLFQNPGGRNAQLIRTMNRSRDPDTMAPEHIQSSANIPLGQLPDGSMRYLTGFGLGIEDPLRFGKILQGDVGGTIKELAGRANPLIKYPIEAATGRSLFYDGPSGPQELTELDPTLGRIRSNVSDLLTGERTDRPEPFISHGVEHLFANSPYARYGTVIRQATDPRKWESPLGAALNLGTGLRVADVSPAAQDSIATQRASKLFRELGGRNQTIPFFPADKLDKLNPEDRETVEGIKGLLKTVQERRKMRREMEQAKVQEVR